MFVHPLFSKLFTKVAVIFIAVLSIGSEVFAQAATPLPQPGFGELLVKMIPMLIMVFIIFYFLVLKPQQVRLKAQEDMLAELKKGDKVLTAGGIIGKVWDVADDSVSVEVSQGVRIKFIRSKILKKIEKSEPTKSAA